MSTWKSLVCSSMFGALFLACGDEGSPTPSDADTLCERICARSAAADCAREPADCEERCAELSDETPARCTQQRDTLTSCLSRARFSCDEDDESSAPACDAKLEAWDACVNGSEPGPAPAPEPTPSEDLARMCDRLCVSAGLAHCPSNTFCTGCDQVPARTPAACGGKLTAMLACRADAHYTCDAEHDADTADCTREDSAFYDCMEAHGATEVEPPPAGAMCTTSATDTTCGACQKDACCAEYSACGKDCVAVFDCYDQCADEACYAACDGAHPEGAGQVASLYRCAASECRVECDFEQPEPEPAPGTAPDGCLPIDVNAGETCVGTGKSHSYDCPSGSPYPDCVLSPTGWANVFCCDQ